MIYFLIYMLLFFAAAILQTVFIPKIEIFGAQPNFLLILVVLCGLRHGTLAGCFMGFIAGLFCDAYAPIEWFGAYSLSFCIVGFAVGQVEESIVNLSLLPKIIILAAVFFLNDSIYYFSIGKNGDEILRNLISLSLPNAVYTLVFGALFFYFLTPRIESKIGGAYKL